jgi:hypothetical protein
VGTLNLRLQKPGTMQKAQCQNKMFKMWTDFAVSGHHQDNPICMHVWDVFFNQGDRIELIPFALCQVSQDTSLVYQQHII